MTQPVTFLGRKTVSALEKPPPAPPPPPPPPPAAADWRTGDKGPAAEKKKPRRGPSPGPPPRRSQIAELQRHVQARGADLQQSRDENRRHVERVAATDRRLVQLEGEARSAQQ